MALQGKIIRLGRDELGFEFIDYNNSAPIRYRQVWPIGWTRKRGMCGFETEDAIGREATCQDGRVSCYMGNGAYLDGGLPEGGSTKSVIFEKTDVPRPKCRTETRWQNGRWQKYLKSSGWVAC